MAKVYLLGAGPGDLGLLTLRVKEILNRAEVVVYDYLANKEILKFCHPKAELVYVGKQGGSHTLSQKEINDLLVSRAKAGLTVARLKGGDPYIFGRGAEEAEVLFAEEVEFEVVPGVSSAIAAPAYAGIPLTHRKYASSVAFITGHEDPQKTESQHNWEALAKGTGTLVFFMGVKNLANITQNLILAGMDKHKPAALIRWGTTCEQRTLCATLDTISQQARENEFSPPALLVIGEVVRLKKRLEWFEKRVLLGKGVVITRAREQASNLMNILIEMGACCYQFPTIHVQPLEDYSKVDEAIKNLNKYGWVIFTSVNGVYFFWQQLALLGLDTRSLAGCKIAAIGPATTDILRKKGVEPEFVPEKYVAESIVQGLLDIGIEGQYILIPRAEKAREVLPQELSKAGAYVELLPIYRTVLANEGQDDIIQALNERRIDYITFTSSSTVDNFFRLVDSEILKQHTSEKVKLACIGPITATTLENYGFKADIIASEYTIPALAKALYEDSI